MFNLHPKCVESDWPRELRSDCLSQLHLEEDTVQYLIKVSKELILSYGLSLAANNRQLWTTFCLANCLFKSDSRLHSASINERGRWGSLVPILRSRRAINSANDRGSNLPAPKNQENRETSRRTQEQRRMIMLSVTYTNCDWYNAIDWITHIWKKIIIRSLINMKRSKKQQSQILPYDDYLLTGTPTSRINPPLHKPKLHNHSQRKSTRESSSSFK